jgi:hypothetical protein
MSVEENKSVVRRFYKEAVTGGTSTSSTKSLTRI